MYCAECGQKIPSDSRFCFNCGHPTAKDSPLQRVVAVEESPRPAAPSGQPGLAESLGLSSITTPTWVRSVARRGWAQALLGAGAASVAIFVLGLVLAVVDRLLSGFWAEIRQPLSLTDAGAILGYSSARFRIDFVGFLDLGYTTYNGTFSAIGSTLTLFGLSALFITLGARRAVTSAGFGDHRERLLQGVKFGLCFALIALAGSYLFGVDEPGTTLGPNRGSALWWGLGMGVFFGLLGAAWSIRRTEDTSLADVLPESLRGWGHALTGAWTSIRYGLVISAIVVVVYFVVAFLRDPFSTGPDDAAEIVALILAIVLLLPDAAAFILLGSHGASYEVTWLVDGERIGPTSYNYFDFPVDDPARGITELAPWYLFALLLIPLIATLVGAYRAARSTGAATREDAWRAGLLMAVPYGALLTLLGLVAARVQFRGPLVVSDFRSWQQTSLGFGLIGLLVLGGLWAVVGSWLSSKRFRPEPATPAAVPTESAPSSPAKTESVACTPCGASNNPGNQFCVSCGAPVSQAPQPASPESDVAESADADCPSCGQTNPAHNAFCTSCGKPLG